VSKVTPVLKSTTRTGTTPEEGNKRLKEVIVTEIVWDTNLYIITLDLDVEVVGDSSCLNTEEPC